jgi:hypothetical protein
MISDRAVTVHLPSPEDAKGYRGSIRGLANFQLEEIADGWGRLEPTASAARGLSRRAVGEW